MSGTYGTYRTYFTAPLYEVHTLVEFKIVTNARKSIKGPIRPTGPIDSQAVAAIALTNAGTPCVMNYVSAGDHSDMYKRVTGRTQVPSKRSPAVTYGLTKLTEHQLRELSNEFQV